MSVPAELSAILITRNEASNIVRCLDSLSWIGEVIMADSGSADNTIELASAYKNVRVIRTEWKGFTETKKMAVSHTSHDWVLWIDADEVVPEELKNDIIAILSSPHGKTAFDMPRKTFFLGEWIQHCGWYPGRVIRLFNKHSSRFNDNILHEGIEVPDREKLGHLNADLLHYSYTSLYQYFDKMNYYGKAGAEELKRKGKAFHFYTLIVNPLVTFIRTYFLKKGFLDGKKGFIIAVGSSFSNFIKYTNFYYLTKKDNNR